MAKKTMIPDLEGAERAYSKNTNKTTPPAEKPTVQKAEQNEVADAESEESEDSARVSRVGRPRNRTFTKKNAIPLSVYFPAEMKDTLESASFFGKVDQSDIVRAAVQQFIKEHTNKSQLKPSGLTIVRDYIADTTVK